jgi:hypothetical protein
MYESKIPQETPVNAGPVDNEKENDNQASMVMPVVAKTEDPPMYDDEELNNEFGSPFMGAFFFSYFKLYEKSIPNQFKLFQILEQFPWESLPNAGDGDPPFLQLYQITAYTVNAAGEVPGSRVSRTYKDAASRQVTNPGFREDDVPIVLNIANPNLKDTNIRFYITLQVPEKPPPMIS